MSVDALTVERWVGEGIIKCAHIVLSSRVYRCSRTLPPRSRSNWVRATVLALLLVPVLYTCCLLFLEEEKMSGLFTTNFSPFALHNCTLSHMYCISWAIVLCGVHLRALLGRAWTILRHHPTAAPYEYTVTPIDHARSK